jgi:hypothetical protein
MKDGPWVKLNTEHSWTCGYADSSSVVKPMSQPRITLPWLQIWLLAIASLLENIS